LPALSIVSYIAEAKLETRFLDLTIAWLASTYQKSAYHVDTTVSFALAQTRSVALVFAIKIRQDLQTTVREAISPGAREGILSIKNDLRKILIWQNVKCQETSHYMKCPAFKILCNSLCGPLIEKFGEPW